MSCPSRYAEAWEFASYWCASKLLVGTHQSGTNTKLLCDPAQNFLDTGVEVGMQVDNITAGASGYVSELDGDGQQLTVKLSGGTRQTWQRGDTYRLIPLTLSERTQLEMWLDTTAAEITAAVQAQGGCECLSESGLGLLKSLQMRSVSTYMSCGCSGTSFTDTRRQQLRNEVERVLALIRGGEIDLCGGSGSMAPAFGVAEQALTVWNTAEIIWKRVAREGL